MMTLSLDIAPNLAQNAISAIKEAIKQIDPKAKLFLDDEMSVEQASELDKRIEKYKNGSMKFKSINAAKADISAFIKSYK